MVCRTRSASVPGSARSGQCHTRSGMKTLSPGPRPASGRPCCDRISNMAAPPQSSAFHGMRYSSYPSSHSSPSMAPYWAGRRYHGYSCRSRNRAPRRTAVRCNIWLAAARSRGVPRALIPSQNTDPMMTSVTAPAQTTKINNTAGTAWESPTPRRLPTCAPGFPGLPGRRSGLDALQVLQKARVRRLPAERLPGMGTG
jgi:hypothetical protein